MFRNLAQFCFRRRWLVLGTWIVLLAALGFLGAVAAGEFAESGSLPGSESQRAYDLLKDHGFDSRTGEEAQIVFQADGGVADLAVREPMEHYFLEIEAQNLDVTITSPYTQAGADQISDNGEIAYATVYFSDRTDDEYVQAADELVALGDQVDAPGTRIEYGGWMFSNDVEPFSEAIGLIGAALILLVAFGSVLAMGVPIVTALFGIGSGAMLAMLGANVIGMPDFTIGAAMMIGIGVGIDYALFILTRYRQSLSDGHDPEEATMLAMDTSGRAVLFAGVTVILAMLGLLVMNIDTVNGVAVAIAASVLMTMFAALTLLPALLGFIRERIDRFGLPHRRRPEGSARQSFWQRWSGVIQRRPWAALLASGLVLLALAAPVAGLRLGFSDAGSRPEDDTSRQAYDLLAEGFGPGFNGPLMLVTELPNGESDLSNLDGLTAELRATDGIAAVSPAFPSPDGQLAVIQVIPTSAPQDQETQDLVHHLRDDVLPAASAPPEVLVSGSTALESDFTDYLAARTPLFFAIVLGLSFLLLMVVFRSILVPLKAVVMNMLSIGAAYGVMVAIFQWGWFSDQLGTASVGPIEAWVPMMLFPIVFGLSMDYEVFLLSRIREEYDRNGDNARAVADGLASTARVISAAAAIMVVVFLAFGLSPDRSLQMLGVGLALAVLFDATIVRLILVPATMELLGDRNWWIPARLNRILPVVHVESERAVSEERSRALDPVEAPAD